MNTDTSPARTATARDVLEETPVFALNTVLYPGGPLPLRIFEPRYVDMVSDRLRRDAPFIVALIRDGREVGGGATTHSTGTLARIVDWNRQDDGLLGITALGGRRVQVLDTTTRPDGLCVATARMLPEEPASDVPGEHRRLAELLRRLLGRIETLYHHVTPRFDDAGRLPAERAAADPARPQAALPGDRGAAAAPAGACRDRRDALRGRPERTLSVVTRQRLTGLVSPRTGWSRNDRVRVTCRNSTGSNRTAIRHRFSVSEILRSTASSQRSGSARLRNASA